MGNGDADGLDAVALDQNFAGLDECAGAHLEQAGGVEDDGGGLLGGESRADSEGRGQNEECAKASKEIPHGYDYGAMGLGLSMGNAVVRSHP
jgi:hypothetical protein